MLASKMSKQAISVAGIVLTLASCANTEHRPVASCVTTEHRDYQKARMETSVVAGLACSLVAGSATYLITGKGQYSVAAAGMAGVICGLAGYSYADKMIKHRNELADKEECLDKWIKQAQYANWYLKDLNAGLGVRLVVLYGQIDVFASGVRKNEISKQELVQQKKIMDEQITSLQIDLSNGQEDLANLAAFKSTDSAELDKEIEDLTVALDRLKRNKMELVMMRQRLP